MQPILADNGRVKYIHLVTSRSDTCVRFEVQIKKDNIYKSYSINKYGFDEFDEINDDIGLSGEEFEMLVSFAPEHYTEVMEIAKKSNTPLTVYAKVAKNSNRYKCKSHHF